jgi:hypothetical protein
MLGIRAYQESCKTLELENAARGMACVLTEQGTSISPAVIYDPTRRPERGEFAVLQADSIGSHDRQSGPEIGMILAVNARRLSIILSQGGYMARGSVLSDRDDVCSGFMKRPATCWPRRSAPSGFVFCRREHRIPKDQI